MRVAYEKRDVRVARILQGAVIITAATLLSFWLMWGFLGALVKKQQAAGAPAHPRAADLARALPPAPTLQAAPRDDLLALRAREDAELGSYAWIDRDKGLVRIPIERAMELVAERGLPSRTGGGR